MERWRVMTPTLEQVKVFARKFSSNATLANPDEKALHTYTDTAGEPLYWRIRLKNTATGEKWIRPFHHDSNDFVKSEPPAPNTGKTIYSLHLLAQYPDALLWIMEGEKAADALNKAFKAWGVLHQHVATTSGGAQSAHAADWTPLAGRRAVAWPDNDDPGAKYAAEVCECLRGVAASVMTLDISGLNLPEKGDAFDWLQREGADYDALMVLLDYNTNRTHYEKQQDNEGEQVIGEYQTATDSAAAAIVEGQPETEAQTIVRLATLSPLEYDRVRVANAERLNVRPTALDAQVKLARKEVATNDGISFGDCEPWHDPVEPAGLLSELSVTVRRFIVCGNETADAVALWAAMTWFIDVVQVAPLAVITAPEKRCGKSQLLFLLGRLSCRPLTASNISSAALFRVIDAWQPTLLVDEADAFMRENEELRGLLNCGHTRDSAYTVRIVGEAMTPTRFNVWGAKAIAGIGHLADTLMDRAVTLELRRKLEHEIVERLRHAEPDLFETLAAKLARFAEDYREAVRVARPDLPSSLNDRAQDNWEPLLAIAQVAGGVWPDRARHAALRLSGTESATVSAGTELLADIQEVFEHKRVEKISTADLIHALCEDEEKCWATWNRGQRIKPRQLAKRLGEYGITSKTIRLGYDTAKGFEAVQFKDAFARYLAPPPENGILAVTPSQPNNNEALSVTDNQSHKPSVTQSVTLKPFLHKACDGVTDKKGEKVEIENDEVTL